MARSLTRPADARQVEDWLPIATAPVVTREVWHVHVYRDGRYQRTIEETFGRRKQADAFCVTFNQLNGDDFDAVAMRTVSTSRPRSVL